MRKRPCPLCNCDMISLEPDKRPLDERHFFCVPCGRAFELERRRGYVFRNNVNGSRREQGGRRRNRRGLSPG